jgi:A/G-specific adenine glycosylase
MTDALSPVPLPQARDLIDWYDRQHRKMPWRIDPAARLTGVRPDPYRVWISEIMLQQTPVAAVRAYFEKFTTLWPTVADLAAADEADVMKAWAGLGYYSRARNLKRCAEVVVSQFGGRFPYDEARLLGLPGIGPYTAAAITAIAFGKPALVVDGNVERVMTRLFAIETVMPEAKREVRDKLALIAPNSRPGEFAEATMDLGATICTPTKPACALCPWRPACRAVRRGDPERFPVKPAKSERPTREGLAFVVVRADGAVLLRRRPPRGLLGGMSEVPNSGWDSGRKGNSAIDPAPLVAADWVSADDPVEHIFTHFRLLMGIKACRVGQATPAPEGYWWSSALEAEALPTVMRKVIAAGMKIADD